MKMRVLETRAIYGKSLKDKIIIATESSLDHAATARSRKSEEPN